MRPTFLLLVSIAVMGVTSCGWAPERDLTTSTSAIRGCPRSHPDYPDCGPTPPIDPDNPPGCAEAVQGYVWASPSVLTAGQSTTVGWSVVFPANCTPLGVVTLNSQPVVLEGTQQLTPLADVVYRLRLDNRELATTLVTVNLPQTVRITQNTYEHKRMMVQALRTPGSLVLLGETLDMDLTGFQDISIARGVTLRSERPIQFEPMTMNLAVPGIAVPKLPVGPRSAQPASPWASALHDQPTQAAVRHFLQ